MVKILEKLITLLQLLCSYCSQNFNYYEDDKAVLYAINTAPDICTSMFSVQIIGSVSCSIIIILN